MLVLVVFMFALWVIYWKHPSTRVQWRNSLARTIPGFDRKELSVKLLLHTFHSKLNKTEQKPYFKFQVIIVKAGLQFRNPWQIRTWKNCWKYVETFRFIKLLKSKSTFTIPSVVWSKHVAEEYGSWKMKIEASHFILYLQNFVQNVVRSSVTKLLECKDRQFRNFSILWNSVCVFGLNRDSNLIYRQEHDWK